MYPVGTWAISLSALRNAACVDVAAANGVI
jgi:hypothetical protein